ncbi:MAG TPA: hypothetical protein VIK71_05735 [Flavobacteriales bacterium]
MLREHNVVRILWFLLAMHILNCAAQKPDMQLRNLPPTLEENEMENIVEVVVDLVMDMVDDDTNKDNNDHNDHNDHKKHHQLNNDLDFSDYRSVLKYTLRTAFSLRQENAFYTKRFPDDIVADYLVPPPRV